MKVIKDIPSGKVIGAGKIKIFMTTEFPYEIPTLSFIVSKDNGGNFISTCIQLIIDGSGETPQSAMQNMKSHIIDFLTTLFLPENKEFSWEQLHSLFNDTMTQDLWCAYRDFQLNCAEKGISTSVSNVLYDKIAELNKQIADLQSVIKKKNNKIETKIVEYKENYNDKVVA